MKQSTNIIADLDNPDLSHAKRLHVAYMRLTRAIDALHGAEDEFEENTPPALIDAIKACQERRSMVGRILRKVYGESTDA